MIYCSRGFNSPLSNAEGWASSNIQFLGRNACHDCWNILAYCPCKYKLVGFFLVVFFVLFLELFICSAMCNAHGLVFQQVVGWIFPCHVQAGPCSAVQRGLQDAHRGTGNQRAQLLCGLHCLFTSFQGYGEWVSRWKGLGFSPRENCARAEEEASVADVGSADPSGFAALLQLSLCVGLLSSRLPLVTSVSTWRGTDFPV